jgi:acyl homoserine lactone synthase
LIGALEMGLQFGATDSVGVFDARMVRIYRRLGWEPTVLGTKGEGKDKTSVGLWELNEPALDRMCKLSGISRETSRSWFDNGFSHSAQVYAA